MAYIKVKPEAIETIAEKPDVTILYMINGGFWLCDKNFKPQKLRDGRLKYRLATK